MYIGDRWPAYGNGAIRLCDLHSGLTPHVLGSSAIGRYARKAGAQFTAIEDFYSPSVTGMTSKIIRADESFRGGFWHKALERFFVLDQYLATHKRPILHAELDQLLFRADKLVEELSAIEGEKGIFIPFHKPDVAIGSLVYINDRSQLGQMLNWAETKGPFPNEMRLIADWARVPESRIYTLPTLANHLGQNSQGEFKSENQITPETIKGVVDAAQLGQWVGGVDPRNVPWPQHPTTLHCDKDDPDLIPRTELEMLSFKLDRDSQLRVRRKNYPDMRLYNLHLHSKIHGWLSRRPARVTLILQSANSLKETEIPGARGVQIGSQYRRFLGTLLRRTIRKFKMKLGLP